ncbi:MAG: 30S ribosomal protein S21 [bacterium]
MISIKVNQNESIDRALRRFKRKCQQAGLYRAIRRSRQFIKPSDKRKMAKQAATRRYKRRNNSRR